MYSGRENKSRMSELATPRYPNESKKRETAQMFVDIKGPHLELFWGRGNSPHTALVWGVGKNKLRQRGVTEKVKNIWYKIINFLHDTGPS